MLGNGTGCEENASWLAGRQSEDPLSGYADFQPLLLQPTRASGGRPQIGKAINDRFNCVFKSN